jgi:NTP pyrophosphatase (non-canonical NTP hydrolase)
VDIDNIKQKLADFAAQRDWQQYHSPKNLAMALTVEAGELLELFQWLSEEQSARLSDDDRRRAGEELADIQLYLIRLADRLGIDLEIAVHDKLRINEEKYPVELSRGNATKYNRR